jgi:hypothetical protein
MAAAAPLLEEDLEIVLRGPTPPDDPLIFSSWERGARAVEPYKSMAWPLYRARQDAHMKAARARSRTIVACFPTAPSEIAGWVCVERDRAALVVHWMYVVNGERRRRVGKRLYEAALDGHRGIVAFPQWSKHVHWILPKLRDLAFDPFLVR